MNEERPENFTDLVDVAETANRRADDALARAWAAEEHHDVLRHQYRVLRQAASELVNAVTDADYKAAVSHLTEVLRELPDTGAIDGSVWLSTEDLDALGAVLGQELVDAMIDRATRHGAFARLASDLAADAERRTQFWDVAVMLFRDLTRTIDDLHDAWLREFVAALRTRIDTLADHGARVAADEVAAIADAIDEFRSLHNQRVGRSDAAS